MATIVWTGAAGDGDYNNAANWMPAQVPGVGDTVTISPAAATAINVANDAVGALTTNAHVTLNLANASSFTIGSAAGGATTFSNGGTFALNSANNATDLIVGATSLTLTGGGTIILSDNGNNAIEGAAASDVLDNVNNLIEGAGQLGNGTLTFINGAAGVVNANDSNALMLNTGAKATTNAGLIESTGAGGLVLNSVVNDGTTGTISAAGGYVYLQGGTIEGGVIDSGGGATVIDNGGGTLNGSGKTVTINGTVVVANANALNLLGVITNNGTINLNSQNNNTDLVIGPSGAKAGTVTLAGKGQVVLSNNSNNFIYGAIAGDTLVNKSETISGGGSFTGPLVLVNDATIDATAPVALVLNTGGTVTNNKLLEATQTGGGGLVIETTVNSSTLGTILANGGNVYLAGGTLAGGIIKTINSGDVVVASSGTLDGTAHTVTNDGTVVLNTSTSLDLLGTITNAGTIWLQSTNAGTDLLAGPTGGTVGTVTLTGGGVVTTTDNGNNAITAASAGDTLINLNNTIEGAGAINGSLTLINDGTIDATDGNALFVATAGTVTNNALMEATAAGGGGLVIETTVDNSGGGTILAAGGNVYLSGGTLLGGTINSSGGGALVDNGGGTLNGLAQAVTNLGSILVANNNALSLAGSIINDGTLSLGSSNNGTDLYIASATVSLTGAGTIVLSNNANNFIQGDAASDVLDNVNNVIEGGGQLGYGTLTLVNGAAGVIDANVTTQLTLNTGSNAVANSGLIEATNGAGLTIFNTVVNDSTGGTVLAAGGDVYLNGGEIIGGTLNTSGGGAIVSVNVGELNGAGQAVTNLGTVVINNDAQLNITGTITNDGVIQVNSSNNGTELELQSAKVTLSGAGTIVLTDNGNNYILGAAASDVLDNVNNLIEGSGQLGDGQMTLINGAAGVISATGTASQLIINTGAKVVSNSGLLESVGPAGLQIAGTAINDGTKGVIAAAGGNVFFNNATIEGGKLTASAGGSFFDQSTAVLSGVTNDATVNVDNAQTLYALGTLTNVGTIALNSGNNATELQVGPGGTAGTMTLTGGGQVVLSNNSNNYIFGQIAGDTLVNLNNTISGAGDIGDNQLVLINDATINANDGVGLEIYTGNTVTNNGLLESTSTGGLQIYESTINNGTKGVIAAAGGGVTLNGATIEGGTLTGSGGFYDVTSSTLDGTAVSVTNDATVAVSNAEAMFLLGTIVNAGTIAVNSANNGTYLEIGPSGTPGTVTLTGGGQVILSNNGNNYLFGQVSGDTLINLNNTISGAGNIGDNQLTLINDATIDATDAAALTLQTNVAVTNNALIEATGAGGLSILNTTVNNGTLGTILANAASVTLNGATIEGGTMSGSGTFYAVNGSTLDGVGNVLTNLGTIVETNAQSFYLEGTIDNQGTILEDSQNNGTNLILDGATVTLTGGGTLSISDNGNNYLYGATAATVLDNVNNTIEGSGNLGDGQMTLVDAGIIAATGGNALNLNVGTTGTITSTGELLGIGSGGLSISDGVYTNSGIIEAEDGSSVTFQSTATLTNSAGGTLTGGVYEAVANGNGATLNLGGTTAITTDSAQLVLSGAGATIESGGVSLGASLDNISQTGVLALLNGINYTTTADGGDLTDHGLMVLEGGTYTGTTLTIASGATLSGYGTLATAVVNDGTISVAGGKMTFDGPVTGTGTIVMGANGVLYLVGGGTLGQNVSGTGTLDLLSGSYSLGAGTLSVTNLSIGAGASLSGSGTLSNAIANSGTLMAAGGTLTLDNTLGGAGTVAAAVGAEVAINGGGTYSGDLSGDGTILISSATTLDQGATINAAEIVQSAMVTLGSGENLNNQAGNVFMLTANAAPDARHRAQIELSGAAGDTLSNAGSLVADGNGESIVNVAFHNSGMVNVMQGELRFDKALSGDGTLAVNAGASLDLAGSGSSFSGAIMGAGTVRLEGVVTLDAGATLAAAKTIDTNNLKLGAGENLTNLASSTFSLSATAASAASRHRAQIEVSGTKSDSFTNLGAVVASGSGTEEFGVAFVNSGRLSATAGTLSFLNTYSGSGSIAVSAGAVIDLTGATTISGVVSGAGTVLLDNATTLLAGANLAVADIVETDNLTLGAGESIANHPGNIYTITTGTTAAVGSPHRAQITVTGATGDHFANSGTLVVNGTGSASFAIGVVNTGSASVGSGTLSFLGAVTNSGTMSVAGATETFSKSVAGTGTLDVGASGTLSLLAGAGVGQTVDFMTGTGLVDLAAPLDFAGTVAGFGAGDVIDLANTAETGFTYANNTLTVKDGSTVVASVKFAGSYTQGDFNVVPDSGTGHQIVFV